MNPQSHIGLLMLLLFIALPDLNGETIRNPLGEPTGNTIGIEEEQFIGSRYVFTNATRIIGVGAQLKGTGSFFAAVVKLTSTNDLPNGLPFDNYEVVTSTVFTCECPTAVTNVSVPLRADLYSGVYGIVIGSGRFGSSGWGGAVTYNAAPGSSDFFWSSYPWRWQRTPDAYPTWVFTTNGLPIGPTLSVFTAVELVVPTEFGLQYQVKISDDLASWDSIGSPFDGTGFEQVRFYSTRGLTKRFFRVEVLPTE